MSPIGPSRRTRACGADAARRAASARSPRYSVRTSAPTIGTRPNRTRRPSRTSPRATARIPAAARSRTNGSAAERSRRRTIEVVGGGSSSLARRPPAALRLGRGEAHRGIDAERLADPRYGQRVGPVHSGKAIGIGGLSSRVVGAGRSSRIAASVWARSGKAGRPAGAFAGGPSVTSGLPLRRPSAA